MKKQLTEETFIFFGILKWFIIATILGVLVGISDAAFLKLLDFTVGKATVYKYYYIALPVVFIALTYLSKKLFPRHRSYTTDSVISSINNSKKMSLMSSLKAFVLPILTIMAGGSVGKEAPCADVGAGIGSGLSRIFKFGPEDRRKLMICGVSAGFAGVFGVPISGALFGLEVLFVGKMFYDVMFPALVAGITAFQITSALGVGYQYHPIDLIYVFSEGFFIKVIAAGIFFGLCSFLLIEFTKYTKLLTRFFSIRFSKKTAPLIIGALLVAIGLLTSPAYLGLGMNEINSALHGNSVSWYGFLIKMLTTSLTFAAGGIGGIITPILFIGSYAGSSFAGLFGLDPATFAALGLVSVLAGAANTPIAASIMAIELFGAEIAPYATVCCIISFLMTGHRGVFPSQILSFRKHADIDVEVGGRISRVRPRVKKSVIKKITNHFKPPFKELFAKNEMKQFEEKTKRSSLKIRPKKDDEKDGQQNLF